MGVAGVERWEGDGGERWGATGVEKDFWRFNVLMLGSASQNAV